MKSRLASTTTVWLSAAWLCLATGPVHGIDLSAWARHHRQYRDWTVVDFRDPLTGLFLAARAGTEDPGTHATLTITAGPADGCAPEAVVVIGEGGPAASNSEEIRFISAILDDQAPQRFRVLLVRQKGDQFLFMQVLEGLDPGRLQGHRKLGLALPGGAIARFSLAGFASAWKEAEGSCRAFLPP
jgi:hypothetical protein